MKTLLYFLLFGFFCCQTEGQCKGRLCFSIDCFFKGTYYKDGESIKDVCFFMICDGGNWKYRGIDPTCAKCRICDDPHFRTFDVENYDWHGVCNYSLSQPFCQDKNCSYSPEYAIYGDFAKCYYDTRVSCLSETTYKVDPFTAVFLQHNKLPDQIEINNNVGSPDSQPQVPFNCETKDFYPVIVWKNDFADEFHYDTCIFIVSHYYSLIACPICLFIFTMPTQKEKINGLCGFYDGGTSNEFIARDDCRLTPVSIPTFASSWTTLQQNDDNKCCPQLEIDGIIKMKVKEAGCDIERLSSPCKESVNEGFKGCLTFDEEEFNNIVADCVEDCCGDPKNEDHWIENAAEVAHLYCSVLNETFKIEA